MSGKRIVETLLTILLLASLLISCGAPAAAPQTSAPTTNEKFKLAMILPGAVQDADYNFLGFQALKDIEEKFGIETSHQEQVAPADAERVARGFIDDGYNIIAFHGGQFLATVRKLAPEFPEVIFISESSGNLTDLPPNVWNIGRKYYQGFYTLGTMAAMATESKKVGVVLGLKLPDFVASVHAIRQAAADVDPEVEVLHAATGDQNDPSQANQAAKAMVDQGVDVIILVVNLGAYGVVDAVKGKEVLLTTYYTDKTDLAPENFAVSLLFDFGTPFTEIIQKISEGQKGGYYELRPGAGMSLSEFHNVSDEVAQKTKDVFEEVAAGKKELPEITTELE